MKTVISGRLIKKPELKSVVLKDGREEVVCDYSLWVSDASAPVRTGSDGKPVSYTHLDVYKRQLL